MNGGSNMRKGDEIPVYIVPDILSKLPSRSVLRFKVMCKSWYALISDPTFLHLHSKQLSSNPKLLFSTSNSHIRVLDYDTLSFTNSCLSPPPEGKFHVKIIGSSRGLVCIAVYYHSIYNFFIWNPLTRERRILPHNFSTSDTFYFHGLGYDSVANDFKLVVSTCRTMRSCDVFSLKANSWKIINCPLDVKYYHPGPVPEPIYTILHWNSLAAVLNGVFHWLVVPNQDNDCQIEIVAFDLACQTFEKMQLPGNVPRKSNVVSLFEHKRCLCVSISKVEIRAVLEIWMMKECGSWVSLFKVKNSLWFGCFRLPVLCISTRDEVVCHTDNTIRRCGKEEKEKLDEIRIESCMSGVVLYVETLVSPYAEDGLKQPMLQGSGIES